MVLKYWIMHVMKCMILPRSYDRGSEAEHSTPQSWVLHGTPLVERVWYYAVWGGSNILIQWIKP